MRIRKMPRWRRRSSEEFRRRSPSALNRWTCAIAASLTLFLASCTVPPKPSAEHWTTTRLGLCEDYPEETRSIEKAKGDLAAARAAGATVLRIAFGWDAMEPQRGAFDWSFWDEFVRAATDDHGIQLIPYVCYTPKWAATDQGENYWRSPPRDPGDFGRFLAALVNRYRGRIRSWELWNEPDNQAYWLGTPRQFAELVQAGSAAVRGADPAATIVLGGIAGELDFLATALRDGRLGSVVDVVNVHSYFETWHPNPIEQLPNYLESAAGLIRDTGGRHALWMAETGYSSVGERAEISSVYRAHFIGEHTDEAQAAALVRTVVTAMATNRVSLIAWYRINDLVAAQDVIGDDNNRHLGIRRIDGTPKPATAAFRLLTELFDEAYQVVPADVETAGAGELRPVVHVFRLRDGRHLLAAWLPMPRAPPTGPPQPDNRAATCRVSLQGFRARGAELRDQTGRLVSPQEMTWRSDWSVTQTTLSLRGGAVKIVELSP